jgi:hypothetical protein
MRRIFWSKEEGKAKRQEEALGGEKSRSPGYTGIETVFTLEEFD